MADDEPDVLRLLTLTLRPEGFDLLTARDGDAALFLARAEHPDLILLDRNMPGSDGLAVCRALRAESDPRPTRIEWQVGDVHDQVEYPVAQDERADDPRDPRAAAYGEVRQADDTPAAIAS